MSRAGRREDPSPPAAVAVPEVPPEVQEQLERRARAERVFMACKVAIVRGSPPLWPAEIVGASIGEQWIRNVAHRMQAAAIEAQRAHAAGIALPS